MPTNEKEQREQLLQLIRDALQQDAARRQQYQINDKFKFIRDKLLALAVRVEASLVDLQVETEKSINELAADERLVYVYLYNAHGLVLKTWQKMLIPSVFYEYSVNRPIYSEKNFVESYIRSRPNKAQHGYLTVAIKKDDILASDGNLKDAIGNPVIKVREGSLQFDKCHCFTCNHHDYHVSDTGELTNKEG